MNAAGLIIIALGLILIVIGVKGSQHNIISSLKGVPATASGSAQQSQSTPFFPTPTGKQVPSLVNP